MLVLYVCFVPGMTSMIALWIFFKSEIMVLAVLENGHLQPYQLLDIAFPFGH